MKVWMIIYKITKIESLEILSGTKNTTTRFRVLEIDKVLLTYGIDSNERPKPGETIYIEGGKELELNKAYEYVIKSVFEDKFYDLSIEFKT